MAKRFYVDTGIPARVDEDFDWYIKEGTTVTGIKIIASGLKIREVQRLINKYPLQNGHLTKAKNWYKVRGTGIITNGNVEIKTELHWYQCENIGRVEFKEKQW